MAVKTRLKSISPFEGGRGALVWKTCGTATVPERSTCPLSADERLLRNVGEREERADRMENRLL